jgi:hypothetical protein
MPVDEEEALEEESTEDTDEIAVKDELDSKKVKSRKKSRSGGRLRNFKYWSVVDSILFLLIVLAVFFTMVLTGLAEEPEDIPEFEETSEYPEQLARAFLAGTIPNVNYTDTGGQETDYAGWSVKQILIEDMLIRQGYGPYKGPPNEQSLHDGIENVLKLTLENLVGTERTFVLNVISEGSENDNSISPSITIYGSGFSTDLSESDYISKGSEVIRVTNPADQGIDELKITVELRIYQI